MVEYMFEWAVNAVMSVTQAAKFRDRLPGEGQAVLHQHGEFSHSAIAPIITDSMNETQRLLLPDLISTEDGARVGYC